MLPINECGRSFELPAFDGRGRLGELPHLTGANSHLPCSGALSMLMAPSIMSTMLFAMESPSPVPG